MESISELRKICQSSRLWADTWHGKNIARPLSIYFTRAFLHWGITPNVATGIFLMVGIVGALILMPGARFLFLVGVLLQHLSYVLDHVDGEIARYTKKTSLTGIYFDHVAHYIINPLFFCCVGIGLFYRTGCMANIYLGILGGLSFSLINLIPDLYDLTLGQKEASTGEKSEANEESEGLLKRAFSLLHAICTFPVIMDAFLVCSIFDLIFSKNTTVFLLWFYSISMLVVWTLKLSYLVITGKIDKAHKGV